MNKKFLYETHLHSCEGSACGRTSGPDYIEAYMKKGYAGIIFTDHFFNGNCAVDRSLPWEEKIDLYCLGYEKAYEAAKDKDFDVLFGIEFNCGGDEYLIYGPDKAWLKAHSDIESWSYGRLFEEVHKIGGVVIQAHPFRNRDYIPKIKINKLFTDGFEGYNLGNDAFSDQYCIVYAKEHNIKLTSGSDMHNLVNIDKKLGGVYLPKRVKDSKEFAKLFKNAVRTLPVIKNENQEIISDVELNENEMGFVTYEARLVPEISAPYEYPMFLVNEKEELIPVTQENVLNWDLVK